MNERAKLGLLCLLFLVTLGIAVLMFANAIQAARALQQQNSAVQARDVYSIRPWMTIHIISRLYQVPEDYLDHSLNIAPAPRFQKKTLYEIAADKVQPVAQIISRVQQTILAYRKENARSPGLIQRLDACITPPFLALEETEV